MLAFPYLLGYLIDRDHGNYDNAFYVLLGINSCGILCVAAAGILHFLTLEPFVPINQ